MNDYLNVLKIRNNLGRKEWKVPYEFIAGQWVFDSKITDHTRIIVSSASWNDRVTGFENDWIHASISHKNEMPSYADLTMLHRAVFNDGWAYQIFAPAARHVNIHSFALHLWGRLDGQMIHPDFQELSGINSV